MEAWQQDPNGLAAFQQAAEARATYLEEFAAFQANPYSKLSCIDIGVRGRTMFETDILRHDMAERDFLKDQHANTPHGRAQKETAAIDQQLSYAGNTELALYHIVGHDPHPEQMTQWIHNKVFKPDSFQPKAYELPADPDSNTWTEEELRAYVTDETKPFARRRFVASLVKCETVQDFFDLTNQTHGQPKQVIEQTSLPAIEIVLE